jgi:hypothetical protein
LAVVKPIVTFSRRSLAIVREIVYRGDRYQMLNTVDIRTLYPEAAKAVPAVACHRWQADRRLSGAFLALAGRYAS